MFSFQFVPFRDFIGGKFGSNMNISQAALAKEILAEIPDQVVQYMKAQGVTPKPPRTDVQLPGQQSNVPSQPPPSFQQIQHQSGYPQAQGQALPQGSYPGQGSFHGSSAQQGGASHNPQGQGQNILPGRPAAPNLQGGAPPYPLGDDQSLTAGRPPVGSQPKGTLPYPSQGQIEMPSAPPR